MIRDIGRWASAVIAVLSVVGCYPPQPPVKVNARLSKDAVIYSYQWEPGLKGDVCLLVRCKEATEYAKTVKGNWEYHWMVIDWEIIEIKRGNWPDDYLRFRYYYSWPTPESSILLGVEIFPYRKGEVFRFCLDTSKKPALIVLQEQRSSEPPYKRIGKPSWKVYDAVIASVKGFLGRERGPCISRIIRIVEEKDDAFVVECIEGKLSDKIIVNRDSFGDTFEVRWITPP